MRPAAWRRAGGSTRGAAPDGLLPPAGGPAPRARARRSARAVVRELERRGELWSPAPGLVGLRGDSLVLLHALESRIVRALAPLGAQEWWVPPALPLETLARAEYFASFPQWLSVASHLTDRPDALEEVARAQDPVAAVAGAVRPPSVALPPAVCYHVYAALADRTLPSPVLAGAQATCWRHEGEATTALERGWAFTMREVVLAGSASDVGGFLEGAASVALELAEGLGLEATLVPASDPFFAPTARGKELLQRLQGLKRELLLPLENGRSLAAASLNHHQRFFGEAFDIRLPDGSPASTGCLAFGLERWMLAFLVEHGTDPHGWPAGLELTGGRPRGARSPHAFASVLP